MKIEWWVCAAMSLLLCGGTAAATAPNIVYILADDMGYGDLSCYGQKRFSTPNIDRLAREGIRFTQHYAGSTVCAPSRSTLMTGLHTGHTRVRANSRVPLRPEDLTVAELLKEAGYATGCVGKWGLGFNDTTGAPNKQGFDLFFGYLSQTNAHFYYPPFLWRNGEKVFYPQNDAKKQVGVYSHDAIVEEGLKFIRQNSSGPFFLYMPVTIAHAELVAPEDSMAEFAGKFRDEAYIGTHYGSQARPLTAFAAMVTRLDRDVGRLLDLLVELGIDDNTIVMFSSDNGPHNEGGHDFGFFDSNGPLRGLKRDLYEGGIRVPMIARWPGKIAAGTVSDHVSAFWDFLPTCAELAGVEVGEGLDGISFVPTLLGMTDTQKEHGHLYWEFHEQGKKVAVRYGDWKGLRLNVKKNPQGPIELYNLNLDVGETRDVAGENPKVVARMNELMGSSRTFSEDFPFP